MVKKQPEKWLKMEIEADAQVMDALGNFLTETGAQGVFQETLEPQLPGDFPEQSDTEKIQAYFPDDARAEKRISAWRQSTQRSGRCVIATAPAVPEPGVPDQPEPCFAPPAQRPLAAGRSGFVDTEDSGQR